MNDWLMVLLDLDTCVDLCLYIFSHFFFFFKELYKCLSLIGEKSCKSLVLKTSLTRKRWSKFVLKCMVPKPKAYLSKKYKKVHGIVSQKFELYLIKSMTYGSQMKSFQSICKYIGEGSYMFISTSEKGHLTSYQLCMTWLN